MSRKLQNNSNEIVGLAQKKETSFQLNVQANEH